MKWGRDKEPRVRLSDVAELADAFKGIFEAGVAANKIEQPQQIMLTPEEILREQSQMSADAGWIATGDGNEED